MTVVESAHRGPARCHPRRKAAWGAPHCPAAVSPGPTPTGLRPLGAGPPMSTTTGSPARTTRSDRPWWGARPVGAGGDDDEVGALVPLLGERRGDVGADLVLGAPGAQPLADAGVDAVDGLAGPVQGRQLLGRLDHAQGPDRRTARRDGCAPGAAPVPGRARWQPIVHAEPGGDEGVGGLAVLPGGHVSGTIRPAFARVGTSGPSPGHGGEGLAPRARGGADRIPAYCGGPEPRGRPKCTTG